MTTREEEMDNEIYRLEEELAAAIRERDVALALLAEAAPKCVKCGGIATRFCAVGKRDDPFCDDAHGHADRDFAPYPLGRHIAAALAGQPVEDAEKATLRDMIAAADCKASMAPPTSRTILLCADGSPFDSDEVDR